jgi:hypothetical protein
MSSDGNCLQSSNINKIGAKDLYELEKVEAIVHLLNLISIITTDK